VAESSHGDWNDADGDPGRPFAELRDAGLLWLVNRTALHPRGFALALHFDQEGNATGWSLLGDGTEPWAFLMDKEEDHCFARAEATLAARRPDGEQ
jgi:hypothetical protein